MSTAVVKSALASYLAEVPDVGTLDPARFDSDDLPRRINENPLSPYWDLTVFEEADTEASFGGALGQRSIFRTYSLRLEGWRGFVGTGAVVSDWEALVDRLVQQLQRANVPPSGLVRFGLTSLRVVTDIRARPDVIRLGDTNSRAHHAIVSALIMTFEQIT